MLGLTIVFKWTAWKFIVSSIDLSIAFYIGIMKQDNRILEQQSRSSIK